MEVTHREASTCSSQWLNFHNDTHTTARSLGRWTQPTAETERENLAALPLRCPQAPLLAHWKYALPPLLKSALLRSQSS